MNSEIEEITELIKNCNKINADPNKGIGDDTDKVSEDHKYKYYKIIPDFKLFNKTCTIKLVYLKLNDQGKKLVVLPGFSEKSICWTIGRIFKLKNKIKDKGFSEVYIFDFKSIKLIQDNSEVKKIIFSSQTNYNCFYNDIAHIVDKIIRGIILKDDSKISILGRSAGGGVSLFLYQLKNCDYIDGLNLAAPGYDPNGLPRSLIRKAKNDNLNVRLSYSNDDPRVPKVEIDNMNNKFKELENYKHIFVSGLPGNSEGIHHRIHEALIDNLV